MGSLSVMVGATLAVAFLAFAWTMQRRRCAQGKVTDGDDDVVSTLYVG